jgi:hypothetical protein
MSSIGVNARTYATADAVAEVDVESMSYTMTAQIAQYMYRQLEKWALDYKIPLARDLEFPDYDSDPETFMRKLFGDIERLLENKLVSVVSFVLSDPPGADGTYHVRYRVTYRLERNINTNLIGESGETLHPPAHVVLGAKFSLIAQWSPDSLGRRESAFAEGGYNFRWIPVNLAIFDNGQLTENQETGGFMPTVGDMHVTRLEQIHR